MQRLSRLSPFVEQNRFSETKMIIVRSSINAIRTAAARR
jgi:hypothetical protein